MLINLWNSLGGVEKGFITLLGAIIIGILVIRFFIGLATTSSNNSDYSEEDNELLRSEMGCVLVPLVFTLIGLVKTKQKIEKISRDYYGINIGETKDGEL